jgi:hypothetical protein
MLQVKLLYIKQVMHYGLWAIAGAKGDCRKLANSQGDGVKIGTISTGKIGGGHGTQVEIEPAISQSADLGLLPQRAADVCGSVNQQARKRRLDALRFGVGVIVTDSKAICGILARGGR